MPFPSLDVTSPPWSDVLFRHALTFSNPTFLDVDWIHSISSTWGIRNREIESLSSLGPPQTIPYFPRAPLLEFKSHHQNSITTLYGSPRVQLNYIWIFLFFPYSRETFLTPLDVETHGWRATMDCHRAWRRKRGLLWQSLTLYLLLTT